MKKGRKSRSVFWLCLILSMMMCSNIVFANQIVPASMGASAEIKDMETLSGEAWPDELPVQELLAKELQPQAEDLILETDLPAEVQQNLEDSEEVTEEVTLKDDKESALEDGMEERIRLRIFQQPPSIPRVRCAMCLNTSPKRW